MTKSPVVYLLDSSIYIFRYYFSLPSHWWSQQGYATEAVYGFATWLLRFLAELRPRAMAACFDESLDSCFRNDIYSNYKSSRALPDDALAFQLQACKTLVALLGIPVYASETYEADDLLATLAHRCRQKKYAVCVLSRDKDLAQIIQPTDVGLWDAPDGECFDYPGLINKMGVRPEQVADYLALVGDAGDDIPGVPGVGPKTAVQLLQYYPGWQELRSDLDSVAALPIRGAAALAQKLKVHVSQIDMALQLTTTVSKAPLGRRFSVAVKKPQLPELRAFSAEMGFGKNFNTTLINRVVEII